MTKSKNTKAEVITTSPTKLEKLFRLFALAILAAAAFAGIMSTISGDMTVRYVVAGVVVFFTSKELLS